MASAAPAARVEDPFGHSSAMNGVIVGLAVGALIGTAILTGGVSLIAVGAAVAITGGAGMAGQAIGQTIPGPDTGVIAIGSPNVAIDRRPAAMTVLATGPCSKDSGPPVPVATGAKTVRINNQLAARVGETMACSAVIRRGSAGVFIGGPSETVIKPTPEVPVWVENGMLAMAIGGTAIGTWGVGLTYGAGAAVGSLVGGVGGSYLGGEGATALAAHAGYGATGQAIAGVAGGFVGGAIGGGFGFKGGKLAEYKIAESRNWTNLKGETWWPVNRGFDGASKTQPLGVGTKIDRFGYDGGTFVAPKGTPITMRALAPGTTSKPYSAFEVVKPMEVQGGKAAPWFGETGKGVQYELPMSVEKALAEGYLRRL